MLNQELNTLQEELQYHCKQVEELEERIAQVKVYDSYAAQAKEAVEEAIKQIGVGKYLWLFKEELLSMFPQQAPQYLEEKVEKAPQEIIESDTTVSEEVEVKKEFGPLSYYKVTGCPDLRPDTFTDLAPNIVYSSSGRAYIGFNDKQEAEKFRDSISEPSMLSDTDTVSGYKYEVKFYCNREYIEEIKEDLENDWTPEQKAELDWQEQLVRIAPDIFYDPSEAKCFMGFSAKGRADGYGSYLTRILDIAEKYTVSSKPTVTTNTKYELVLEQIELDSAQHLSKFNLKKEYDDSKNKDARELWRDTRKRVYPSACKPSPKLTPLNEVKLGDIVYLNSITNQYKVLSKVELDGVPHLEVICTYNSERPSLVGATSYLKECYIVPVEDVQVDSTFQEKKEVPDFKEEELDFPSGPYSPIDIAEVELADIVSTGEYVKAYYEITANKGTHLLARCLYHESLKHREGEEDFWLATPYLVKKG